MTARPVNPAARAREVAAPMTFLDDAAKLLGANDERPAWPARERLEGFAVEVEPIVADLPVRPEPSMDAGLHRWRLSTALRLEGFLRPSADPEDHETGPGRSGRLVEWLMSAGEQTAVQLQLRADPQRGVVEILTLLQVDAPTREDAGERARDRLRELRSLVDDDPLLRFGAVAAGHELAGLRSRTGWSRGRLAAVPGWSRRLQGQPTVAARRSWQPEGPEALAAVMRLLLLQAGPAAVLVSVRPARLDLERPLAVASVHLADVKARLKGRQIWDRDHRSSGTSFSEDLGDLRVLETRLEAWEEQLRDLEGGGLSIAVCVAGEHEPSAPLVHAVQRAVVGVPRVAWRELSGDEVELAAQGPREALAVARAGDAEADAAAPPSVRQLSRVVPARVAAASLQLPTPEIDGLPGLPMAPARPRRVPATLLGRPGFLLGQGRGPRGPVAVRLGPTDLDRHLYLCGRTGTGKSTLLRALVGDLARQGEGVGLLDPHGDLAEDVLADLPPHRSVVVFDPLRDDCPGLDPLAHDGTALGKERAVEDLTAIMFRLYPAEYMGPMFDRHSRALLVPLVAAGEPMANISRLASDDTFRDKCLAWLDKDNALHQDVLTFWKEEYSSWPASFKGEMHSYTVSKYDALVKSSLLRRTCAETRPQLDIHGILRRGDVLVARLPQGLLGPVSAWFLGMLLLSRLQAAVFSRSGLARSARSPFTLVVDEFQGFVGQGGFGYSKGDRTLGPLLSEARKFGLRLVLANQYVAQLDEQTRQALFGNVASLIAFRLGFSDAEVLARELGGGVGPGELRDLPMYHGMARLSRDGTPAPLCSLSTIDPKGLEAWLRGHPLG